MIALTFTTGAYSLDFKNMACCTAKEISGVVCQVGSRLCPPNLVFSCLAAALHRTASQIIKAVRILADGPLTASCNWESRICPSVGNVTLHLLHVKTVGT